MIVDPIIATAILDAMLHPCDDDQYSCESYIDLRTGLDWGFSVGDLREPL